MAGKVFVIYSRRKIDIVDPLIGEVVSSLLLSLIQLAERTQSLR